MRRRVLAWCPIFPAFVLFVFCWALQSSGSGGSSSSGIRAEHWQAVAAATVAAVFLAKNVRKAASYMSLATGCMLFPRPASRSPSRPVRCYHDLSPLYPTATRQISEGQQGQQLVARSWGARVSVVS